MKKVLKKAVEVSKKAVAFGKKAQPVLRTASTVIDVAGHLLKKKQSIKHKKSKKSIEKKSHPGKMKRHILHRYGRSSIGNQILKASAGFGVSELITSLLGPNLFSSGIGVLGSYILAGKIGVIGAAGHFLFRSGFFSFFPKGQNMLQGRLSFLPRRL